MSEQRQVVITAEGKLCFDRQLFESELNDAGKPKWGASMLIDNSEDLTAIKQIMMIEANKMWPTGLPNDLKWGVKAEDPSKLAKYPYMAGCNLVSGGSGFAIPVGNVAGQEVTRDGIKGGDTVRFSVSAYAYNAKGNKGVGLNLNGVLLVSQCPAEEAFFQKANVNSMFGSVMTSYEQTGLENFTNAQTATEAPAADMSSMNF